MFPFDFVAVKWAFVHNKQNGGPCSFFLAFTIVPTVYNVEKVFINGFWRTILYPLKKAEPNLFRKMYILMNKV